MSSKYLLDPELKAFFEVLPLTELTREALPEIRKERTDFALAQMPPLPPEVSIVQEMAPGRNGDPDVRMKAFWKTYRGTSDNLRERPYANIYSRVTTQTNTWRIHYRVQGIKKSRDTAADTFDPQMDSISSESRGSTLLERYIDPSDPALPDFTEKADANLDAFYRFRVLSKRKFSM